MKIPRWLYPKEVNKGKQWLHWALSLLFFMTLISLGSFIFPDLFGFQINSLADYWYALKTMYLPLLVLYILADMMSHSTLKKN